MLTDLRYAMGQLRPIQADYAGEELMPRSTVDDRVSRAIDALERCIEAAQIAADKQAAWDAETDAMIEELCGPAPMHDLGGEG